MVRKKTGRKDREKQRIRKQARRAGGSERVSGSPIVTTLEMPSLHPNQWLVKSDKSRFKVLACGRRWGKTRLVVSEAIETAASRQGLAWWIAPSYKTAHPGWVLIENLAGQIPGAEIRRSDRMVKFPGGGEIWIKTGEDPHALRGMGLDFAALDEFAYMKMEVWQEAIRPALSDNRGAAIFISTPSGHNAFYQLYQLGLDSSNVGWQSWTFPSVDNPFLDPLEIEEAKQDLPDRVYRQEYLAEFITDSGVVFRRIDEGVDLGSDLSKLAGGAPYPRRGFSYVCGVDWGQRNDFTVIVTIEVETGNVVETQRFKDLAFNFQRDRIAECIKKFGIHYALLEENSIGLPNLEELQNQDLPCAGFSTQSRNKDLLIRDLALAFERVQLGIPNDPLLLHELKAYQMNRTPSGLWRYSAPAGSHDDMVIALALAWKAKQEGSLMASFV